MPCGKKPGRDGTLIDFDAELPFWQTYEVWENRIELARRTGRIGDLLVLADESPVAALRAEAHLKAGLALLEAERFDFALEQLELCLAVEPNNLPGLHARGTCLQRLALQGKTSHSLDKKPEHRWQPRQVLLFSGHTVDAPSRPTPRFPLDKVPLAEAQIGKALDQLGAGPDDLGLTQGASGGDLIFAEACEARGVKLQLLQPFPEAEFIERSVALAAGDWRGRFFAVKARLTEPARSMPEELGPSDRDPFERCNLWLLYTALAQGPEKVRFVCLWNGGGGDGPGGTQHMVEEVKKRAGQVIWLDTRRIW